VVALCPGRRDPPLVRRAAGAVGSDRNRAGRPCGPRDRSRLRYIGSAFIATREAHAAEAYKASIVASSASDIVYTNLFTGVHGNYLRASIENAGLDPENLPQSDPSKMDFANSGSSVKTWRDIWGSGQGIGAIDTIPSAAELIARLTDEYDQALEALAFSRSFARRMIPIQFSIVITLSSR